MYVIKNGLLYTMGAASVMRGDLRIENGKTVDIPLSEKSAYLFASTMDGSLSNEIVIADLAKPEITMITKGGFRTVSYPWFVPE